MCAPLVGDTLKGIAGAIFAYGATGAGKTHTMTGLMSRALSHLFTSIADSDLPDAYEVSNVPTRGNVYLLLIHKTHMSRVLSHLFTSIAVGDTLKAIASAYVIRCHQGLQDADHDRLINVPTIYEYLSIEDSEF